MDNPQKLGTYGAQDEDKQNMSTALLHTTGGKDEPATILCGNHNGHHNGGLILNTIVHIFELRSKINKVCNYSL